MAKNVTAASHVVKHPRTFQSPLTQIAKAKTTATATATAKAIAIAIATAKAMTIAIAISKAKAITKAIATAIEWQSNSNAGIVNPALSPPLMAPQPLPRIPE